MDVGIRELKEQLSEFLERASRGELIRITDRGQPKAMLTPIPGTSAIARGIAEGWVQAARSSAKPTAPERFRAKVRSNDVVDDDRGT